MNTVPPLARPHIQCKREIIRLSLSLVLRFIGNKSVSRSVGLYIALSRFSIFITEPAQHTKLNDYCEQGPVSSGLYSHTSYT